MKLRYLPLLFAALLGAAAMSFGSSVLAQTGNETANVTPSVAPISANPPSAAPATAPPAFKTVSLWINPEYDDSLGYQKPSLLVMMEGQLDGAQAPVKVTFMVPTGAGMFSAGSKNPQGAYTGGPPDRVASPIAGWDEVSYTLTQQTFRIEFYDPNIVKGQPDRTISYDFRTISPISDLHVVVQQPRRSSNYSVAVRAAGGAAYPTPNASPDPEGFQTYSYFLTNVSAAQPQHFDISYTKTDNNPSLSPAGGSATNTNVVLIAIAGVIVVGVIVVFVLKSRKGGYVPVGASRGERRRRAKHGGTATGGRFCPSCGQKIDASVKFCPYCGAKTGD